MPIDQEHSLVRYDPSQHTLGQCTADRLRPAHAPAARRSADPARSAATAGTLRAHPAHSIYSPRLTLASPAAAVTGRVVDIFV